MKSHTTVAETARNIRRKYRGNGSAMANESRRRVQDFLRGETAQRIRRKYRGNGSAMANESRRRVQDFLNN